MEYHKSNSKKNTVRAYEAILTKFCLEFNDKDLEEVTSDDIFSFLNQSTEDRKQHTKRTPYSR